MMLPIMQMVAVGMMVIFVCQRDKEREILLGMVFKNLSFIQN